MSLKIGYLYIKFQRQYSFIIFFISPSVYFIQENIIQTPQKAWNIFRGETGRVLNQSLQFCVLPATLFLPGCWYVLSPTRKETSYSDQPLTFASHSKTIQKVVRPTRPPRQQWPQRRTKNGDLSIVCFSRVGLRIYQHPWMYKWIQFDVL